MMASSLIGEGSAASDILESWRDCLEAVCESDVGSSTRFRLSGRLLSISSPPPSAVTSANELRLLSMLAVEVAAELESSRDAARRVAVKDEAECRDLERSEGDFASVALCLGRNDLAPGEDAADLRVG